MIGAWLIALSASGAGSAQQGFPNRPVRVVIPYSAGSVADVFGRIVTQDMAAQWNGSIILESRSGANGSIAAEDAARATSSAAIEPLAPDLDSRMIDPFHCVAMFWVTMRPNTSATLPAE